MMQRVAIVLCAVGAALANLCNTPHTQIDLVTPFLELPFGLHAPGVGYDQLNPNHATSVVNKTFVITGTSSGIGHATAELLSSMGARVFGLSLADPEIPVGNFVEFTVDIRKTSKIAWAVRKMINEHGVTEVDGLMLNAGTGLVGSGPAIEDILDNQHNNVFGNMDVFMQLDANGLFDGPEENVIAWQSSIFSKMPFAATTPYTMTKMGLHLIPRLVEAESLASKNIRNIVTMPDMCYSKFAANAICVDDCVWRCAWVTILQDLVLSQGMTTQTAAEGMVQAITQKLFPGVISNYIGDPARSIFPPGYTWAAYEAAFNYLPYQTWVKNVSCMAYEVDILPGIPNPMNPNLSCELLKQYYDIFIQMTGGGDGLARREDYTAQIIANLGFVPPVAIKPCKAASSAAA